MDDNPYRDAIQSLTARLHLREVSWNSQSWDVEVADAYALEDFQAAYESGFLSEMEKKVLVQVMLESLQQAAKRCMVVPDVLLQRMAKAIQGDYHLHHDSLLLWALPDEHRDGEEYVYRITPFVRSIIMIHEGWLQWPK